MLGVTNLDTVKTPRCARSGMLFVPSKALSFRAAAEGSRTGSAVYDSAEEPRLQG